MSLPSAQHQLRFPFVSIQSRAGAILLRRNPNLDELLCLVDEEQAIRIVSFVLQSRLNKDDHSIHTLSLPPQEDKEKRRQLHLFVKQKYPFVRTSTYQSSIVLATRRVCFLASCDVEREATVVRAERSEAKRVCLSWGSSLYSEENERRTVFTQDETLSTLARPRTSVEFRWNQGQKGHHNAVRYCSERHCGTAVLCLFAAQRSRRRRVCLRR